MSMISGLRLVLAVTGFSAVLIDPVAPLRSLGITRVVLILYVVYSSVVFVLAATRHGVIAHFVLRAHWIDVAWYTLLIALTGGTNSIFFLFYFFATLTASFRFGFASGLRVSLVSTVLFTVVGYAALYRGDTFEPNRFLLRTVTLVALGFILARWGEMELRNRKQLALLKDLAQLANPRFGIGRTLGILLERLRAFYAADTCLLVQQDEPEAAYMLRRAKPNDPEAAQSEEPLSEALAVHLLSVPAGLAVFYQARGARLAWWRWRNFVSYDATWRQSYSTGLAQTELLARMLDADSLISVPVEYQAISGRLVVAAQRGTFNAIDIEFLFHVLEQVMPVLGNIRLVDQLASGAAEQERQKLARDIHDTVIQPYIGLQLMLSALKEKLKTPGYDPTGDVGQLVNVCKQEINNLRSFTRGIKGEVQQASVLVPAIRRFAAKISSTTGINVQVEAEADLRVNDRLAAEVFQLVAEGLSNVRRHTAATWALVALEACDGYLQLRIQNNDGAGAETGTRRAQFSPRSLTERTQALGGQTAVRRTPEGNTEISIRIPL